VLLPESTIVYNCFFNNGATAPSGSGTPHYRGFTIIPYTAHSVGLLWTSDQPDAKTSTWKHTALTTDVPAPSGIRTRYPRKREAVEPRLRPRGHWDWLKAAYMDEITSWAVLVFLHYRSLCLSIELITCILNVALSVCPRRLFLEQFPDSWSTFTFGTEGVTSLKASCFMSGLCECRFTGNRRNLYKNGSFVGPNCT
jgi:hypothetical protein